MNQKYLPLIVVASAVLGGCGNLSGLDASNTFSCAAPDGVTCMSVSGIYANAKANNLPGLKTSDGKAVQSGDSTGSSKASSGRETPRDYGAPTQTYAIAGSTLKTSPKTMTAPNSGTPLRTQERIARVWMAPFEDEEHDLHDQKYFYVTINSGQWTIEANRVNVRNKFQSVYPLSKANPANKAEEKPAMSPQQQAIQTLPVSPVQQQGQAESSED